MGGRKVDGRQFCTLAVYFVLIMSSDDCKACDTMNAQPTGTFIFPFQVQKTTILVMG